MVNIYVGNLSFSATEDDVRELFAAHGQVSRVSLVMDRETGRPRGFGFVEMANDAEGHAAISALNGQPFQGRPLTVNEAKPREQRGGGGGGFRGGGGGFGGGGYGQPRSGGFGSREGSGPPRSGGGFSRGGESSEGSGRSDGGSRRGGGQRREADDDDRGWN